MITLAHMIRLATGNKPPTIHAWPRFKEVQQFTVPAVRDHLNVKDKFYPFSEEVQRKSCERARKLSRKTIDAFGGPWVDVVFREKTQPKDG